MLADAIAAGLKDFQLWLAIAGVILIAGSTIAGVLFWIREIDRLADRDDDQP